MSISPELLPTHISIDLAGKTGERSTSKYNDYLCCALKPYCIYVDKKHKSAILDKIQDTRNVAHPPNDSASALLKLSITMSSRQFNNILHQVNVEFLILRGFAYKADLDMCQDLMKLARKADRHERP